jgi:hypothetical protein
MPNVAKMVAGAMTLQKWNLQTICKSQHVHDKHILQHTTWHDAAVFIIFCKSQHVHNKRILQHITWHDAAVFYFRQSNVRGGREGIKLILGKYCIT